MAHSQDFIQEAIKTANAVAQAAEPALRTHAFEVVLAHLLNTDSSSSPTKVMVKEAATPQANAPEREEGNTTFDSARVATQLELSLEQVEEIYDLRGATLFLNLKPAGSRLPEQRRSLTHLLVVGYKFGLGAKNVAQSKIVEAADEWNVGGHNFSRDIRDKYIHAKAGGKGSDPLLSLAPGSLADIILEAKTALGL